MGSIETEKRATTLNKAGRAGTVADKQSLKLVVVRLFEDSDTVGIASHNVFAVFQKSVIRRSVSVIVELVCVVFGTERLRVSDFNSKLMVDVFDNLDGTICGLLFEFFSNVLCNESFACLSMANMIKTKTGVVILIGFDAIEGGSTDRRGMKTPGAFFCFTHDCIMGGVSFEDFVFEPVCNCVGSACVFKFKKTAERGSDGEWKGLHRRSHDGSCNSLCRVTGFHTTHLCDCWQKFAGGVFSQFRNLEGYFTIQKVGRGIFGVFP